MSLADAQAITTLRAMAKNIMQGVVMNQPAAAILEYKAEGEPDAILQIPHAHTHHGWATDARRLSPYVGYISV